MHTNKEVRFGRYRLAGPHGPLHQGAQTIPLRPKALAVLWELVRRPGEVVTKGELLAAVWSNTVVTDGVITVCLRDLRRALGDDERSPRYIATAHRLGYRFIAKVTSSALSSEPGWQATEFPG